jgi:predicted NUDIX family phosphoesterase
VLIKVEVIDRVKLIVFGLGWEAGYYLEEEGRRTFKELVEYCVLFHKAVVEVFVYYRLLRGWGDRSNQSLSIN